LGAPISFLEIASLELPLAFALFPLVAAFCLLCGTNSFGHPQALPKDVPFEEIVV